MTNLFMLTLSLSLNVLLLLALVIQTRRYLSENAELARLSCRYDLLVRSVKHWSKLTS